MATIDEVERIKEQYAEVVRLVDKGVLTAPHVHRALQAIIEGATSPPQGPVSAEGRFTSTAEQISNLRAWAETFALTLTDEQFDEAAAEAPLVAATELLIPLTLCWTLGDLRSTIDAKLSIVRLVYGGDTVSVSREFRTDAKHTTLIGGAPAFVANRVWWQLIDLGANRFKAPNQVPASTAAGSEVLDVICQHPIYVGQQDGSDTPYLDLPGLSVRVRGVPGLNTPDAAGGAAGGVKVQVRWDGSVYPDHAEPTRES